MSMTATTLNIAGDRITGSLTYVENCGCDTVRHVDVPATPANAAALLQANAGPPVGAHNDYDEVSGDVRRLAEQADEVGPVELDLLTESHVCPSCERD